MLALTFIRENPELVRQGALRKGEPGTGRGDPGLGSAAPRAVGKGGGGTG